ncbi:MAG: hypothetical protein Q3992_06190 [Bacteroides sp.]|nr:hypothetical protein [Bacteroides sp.]
MNKINTLKYAIFAFIFASFAACAETEKDLPSEDYDKLFPFGGIEKPESEKGNLNVKLCDPDMALASYKYPGENPTADSENDVYRVTVTCSYKEYDSQGDLVYEPTSKYVVRYINQKKELVEVHSNKDSNESGQSLPGIAKKKYMNNGTDFKVTFTVRSGFPMYLSVNGVGPRNSSVKASIKAVTSDGLIEIPALETEQYQNSEGPNRVPYPYCEFIILP